MKLPKRLDTVLRKKEEFLDQARAKLENTALKLQTKLFEDIISGIIPRLDVADGKILETANNYILISELDKVYDTFNTKVAGTILPQLNAGIDKITGLNKDYFTLAIADLPQRFDKIIEGAKVITDLKIGLRAGKMIRGGNVMEMLTVQPAEFKQLLAKAVSSQMGVKEFIGIIKDNINGTDIKSGLLDRQLKGYAYDTYQQYDRAYNKKLAEEFEMKYFLYQGGLILDSRDFCVCHNGKVFSIEEAEEWKTWTPNMCEYPPEHPMQAKEGSKYPPDAIPSYLSIPGYSPLDDAGGPRCRHTLGFIPDELAFKYRPELREK